MRRLLVLMGIVVSLLPVRAAHATVTLTITASVTGTGTSPGDILEYSFTVTNTGDEPTVETDVLAHIPADTTAIGDGACPNDMAIDLDGQICIHPEIEMPGLGNPVDLGEPVVALHQVLFSLGPLDPSDSVTDGLVVRIEAGAVGKTLTNHFHAIAPGQATAESEELETDVTAGMAAEGAGAGEIPGQRPSDEERCRKRGGTPAEVGASTVGARRCAGGRPYEPPPPPPECVLTPDPQTGQDRTTLPSGQKFKLVGEPHCADGAQSASVLLGHGQGTEVRHLGYVEVHPDGGYMQDMPMPDVQPGDYVLMVRIDGSDRPPHTKDIFVE